MSPRLMFPYWLSVRVAHPWVRVAVEGSYCRVALRFFLKVCQELLYRFGASGRGRVCHPVTSLDGCPPYERGFVWCTYGHTLTHGCARGEQNQRSLPAKWGHYHLVTPTYLTPSQTRFGLLSPRGRSPPCPSTPHTVSSLTTSRPCPVGPPAGRGCRACVPLLWVSAVALTSPGPCSPPPWGPPWSFWPGQRWQLRVSPGLAASVCQWL